jgi:3,4-dehydroadipyl-CoA semialdehyde dehydrogenase
VEDVVKSGCLPEGALSLICGRAHSLLDHVTGADVIAFTGSAETAATIRSAPAVRLHSARVNIEADSLNAALLGLDGRPGSQAFDLFVKEVVAEMTIKAGQKCTAIRRIIVPQEFASAVGEAISAGLAGVVVGNPRNPAVRMGPLVSRAQQLAVQQGIAQLQLEASMIFDGSQNFQPIDADPGVAAFVAPALLLCRDPAQQRMVHEVEVFGPVATVVPYRNLEDAVHCAALGGGSLVTSVFTGDPASVEQAVVDLAAMHGRINVVTPEVAPSFTGHGNVMPMSLHGGPGRAGGGQELGGLRALRLYHQFSAVPAPKELL